MPDPNIISLDRYRPASVPYRVEVLGELSADWSDSLAGMQIAHTEQSDGQVCSTLTGLIRGRTELNGVLQTLFNLHLNIISVEKDFK